MRGLIRVYDPTVYGAMKMEAAQRMRGAHNTDGCHNCKWREEAFGHEICMNRRVTSEMSREQFHKCVKAGNFWRQG